MTFRLSILVCSTCAAFLACSQTNSTYSPNQQLYGQVSLYDSSGNKLGAGLDGILISVSRTGMTTTTDHDGKWSFDDITPGNYAVTASKAEFKSDNAWNIDVLSGYWVGVTLALTQMPSDRVRLTYAVEVPDGTIFFYALTESQFPYFLVDSSPTASPDDSHLLSPIKAEPRTAHQWYAGTYVYANWQANAGLKAGDTVYVSACATTDSTRWDHDTKNNTWRLIHAGPKSNVIPIILH